MSTKNYVKPERIWMKDHPDYNEKWAQKIIADDPSILGLGNLVLRDIERPQPRAGRLDLLLQDPDTPSRYEVELQLGSTDESHIIRTVEYWDIEQRRYPQYDHYAVIVAEDITSRFLNVIRLFNGTIPLIALQMQAFRVDDKSMLIFSKIVDVFTRGLIEEDEVTEPTDRSYWEKQATKGSLALVDDILELLKSFDDTLKLKYNKFYIGIEKDGQPYNFVECKPRKNYLNFSIRLPQSNELDSRIEKTGLETLEYDKHWGFYRLRLTKEEINKNSDALKDLAKMAYERRSSL